MITEKRLEYLQWVWGEESEDPETQDWREDLTIEEQRLVATWDRSFNLGVRSLCQQILEHEVTCAKMHTPSLNV